MMNRSLLGVVREASEHHSFGEIYGSPHGLAGILSGNLVDLRRQSRAALNRVARTPGAALGLNTTQAPSRRAARCPDGAVRARDRIPVHYRRERLCGNRAQYQRGHPAQPGSS